MSEPTQEAYIAKDLIKNFENYKLVILLEDDAKEVIRKALVCYLELLQK